MTATEDTEMKQILGNGCQQTRPPFFMTVCSSFRFRKSCISHHQKNLKCNEIYDDVALTMSCLFSSYSEYFEVFSYLTLPRISCILKSCSLKLVQNTEFIASRFLFVFRIMHHPMART